ncbi:hypothetical protein K504DRAFT_452231 [Pleomassaria siparia CBS 279.74]|uniref:Uncharacterized protein n=1 Tax=Pleomassaria siparia CBS 279.74 TaxID=1314801 RepID=A0A6G1KHU1_9PLEO|nr:hypothetical protein K504DRAFT_452231 [Pleomassaria siparia CBS 279.74]
MLITTGRVEHLSTSWSVRVCLQEALKYLASKQPEPTHPFTFGSGTRACTSIPNGDPFIERDNVQDYQLDPFIARNNVQDYQLDPFIERNNVQDYQFRPIMSGATTGGSFACATIRGFHVQSRRTETPCAHINTSADSHVDIQYGRGFDVRTTLGTFQVNPASRLIPPPRGTFGPWSQSLQHFQSNSSMMAYRGLCYEEVWLSDIQAGRAGPVLVQDALPNTFGGKGMFGGPAVGRGWGALGIQQRHVPLLVLCCSNFHPSQIQDPQDFSNESDAQKTWRTYRSPLFFGGPSPNPGTGPFNLANAHKPLSPLEGFGTVNNKPFGLTFTSASGEVEGDEEVGGVSLEGAAHVPLPDEDGAWYRQLVASVVGVTSVARKLESSKGLIKVCAILLCGFELGDLRLMRNC